MRCRTVKRELVGLIDKSLDEGKRQVVSEHLWVCPECAGEERRLRAVMKILRSVGQEGPPPSLVHSTRDNVAALGRGTWDRGQGLVRRVWHLSPAALAAAVGLVVLSGLLMAHSSSSGQRARELRQLQERIQAEGLLREARLLQMQMPQLGDRVVLAGVELVLREVVNLDPRSTWEQGGEEIQKRVATSGMEELVGSLVGRAEGREEKVLARLLRVIRETEKL